MNIYFWLPIIAGVVTSIIVATKKTGRTIFNFSCSNFEEIQNKIFNVLYMKGYKNINENNESVWQCGTGFWVAKKYIKIEYAANNTLIISGWIRTSLGNDQNLDGFIACVPKRQVKDVINEIQSYCNNDNFVDGNVAVCGYCNYSNDSESKFCMGCGKELNVKVYCSTNYSQEKCTNCGANINAGQPFCAICGTKATQQTTDYLSNNTVQDRGQSFNNYNIGITDEQLIDAYIGKNAEQMKKSTFSIWSFLFGMFYVIYRKMWLLAAIGIVISLVANLFLPSFAMYIVGAFGWVVAFQFNKWYLANVKENIEKIKSENVGVSSQHLIEICRRKGGTSVLALVIAIICYLAFVIGLTFLTLENTEVEEEWKYNSDVIDSNYTEEGSYSSTDTISSEYFEGYFASVPKPRLDSSWKEEIIGKYREYEDSGKACTLEVAFYAENKSKVENEFEEYKKLLISKGFKLYEELYDERYDNYMCIKDDVYIEIDPGTESIYVSLTSGYLAPHFKKSGESNIASESGYEGYFASVPKPKLDSTWTEEVVFEYEAHSIKDKTYTLGIDFANSDISKIQPKFAEYEQQLKENGFTFYKVYSNHYTYIKDDISIVIFAGYDELSVDLSSGYQAEHYEW